MKNFTVVNQSCYRRQEEIAMVRRFLIQNGLSEDADLTRADLALFFTCAFSQSRVSDMLREIDRMRSVMRQESELIVGSCLPVTDAAALKRVFHGKTITPTDFRALNQLSGIKTRIEEPPIGLGQETSCIPIGNPPSSGRLNKRFQTAALGALNALMRAWPALRLERIASRLNGHRRMGVFISAGCMRRCSYCAIRFATGQLRSKPVEAVARTFSEGLDLGYRKFEVYADSIGDYGVDIGTNLGDVFDWLANHNRQFSVGLYDLHPHAFLKFFDKIFALCRARKVHYLYVPLQSGSQRVLKLMNRPCNLDALEKRLLAIRKLGGVFIQTSIIIGFPSETNQEFEETLAFLKRVLFSDVYVHFYSDMPNTESSRMPGKIGKEVMLQRFKRLQKARLHYDYAETRHEWESLPGSAS
jgi:tRNA A37 methylthiotransferase MiaB